MAVLEPNKSQLNAVHDVSYRSSFIFIAWLGSQLRHYVLCCSTREIYSTLLSQMQLHQQTLELVRFLFSRVTFQFPPLKASSFVGFSKTPWLFHRKKKKSWPVCIYLHLFFTVEHKRANHHPENMYQIQQVLESHALLYFRSASWLLKHYIIVIKAQPWLSSCFYSAL